MLLLFFALIANNIIDKDNDGDYNFFSYTFYSVVIFYVNLKLILINYNYSFIFVLGVLISVLSFICYTYITDHSKTFGYHKTIHRTLNSDLYWMFVSFLIGILFVINLTFYTLKRYIFPTIKSYVRNIQKNFDFEKIIMDLN